MKRSRGQDLANEYFKFYKRIGFRVTKSGNITPIKTTSEKGYPKRYTNRRKLGCGVSGIFIKPEAA